MDEGHQNLITDLEALLEEARNYGFHDFKNKEYAAPKMALVSKLQQLEAYAINGRYDNEPDDEDSKEILNSLK